MDTAYKYGNNKMVLEVYELISTFRLNPNAAIMTYML
jgi:hypothetical protein